MHERKQEHDVRGERGHEHPQEHKQDEEEEGIEEARGGDPGGEVVEEREGGGEVRGEGEGGGGGGGGVEGEEGKGEQAEVHHFQPNGEHDPNRNLVYKIRRYSKKYPKIKENINIYQYINIY